MEKITQSLGQHLKPAKLYLDDIEQIIETLCTVSSEVSISTKDYRLKDVQQLHELKKEQITHLEIRIHEPYVSLSLKPNQIWLYIEKDEPTSRWLFERIKQIVSARERKIARILHSSGLWGILAGSFLPLLTIGILKPNSLTIFASIASLVIAITLALYGFQDRFNKYSIIVLKHEIEFPSFWKRNSDKILLMILSAIFGGFITLVLFKMFGVTP